jgi:hypothetical protein
MPIAVEFSLDDLPADFVEKLVAEGGGGAGGALPEAAVWYVYHSHHDAKVRPSHLALDGSVWRMDDPKAPVPPIDINCRCWIEPVADPDSAAAHVLPPAEEDPKPLGEVYAAALDKAVRPWRDIAEAATHQPAAVRFEFLTEAMRGLFTTRAEASEYARMILVAIGYAH